MRIATRMRELERRVEELRSKLHKNEMPPLIVGQRGGTYELFGEDRTFADIDEAERAFESFDGPQPLILTLDGTC